MKKHPERFMLMILLAFCMGCKQTPAVEEPNLIESGQTEIEVGPARAESEPDDVKLEKNDWSNIWIEDANGSEKPRILFIGDSITEGYYSRVKEKLSDQFSYSRYITSKFVSNPDFLAELDLILKRYSFEIIQVNNGLHGWDYSDAEYKKGLELLIDLIHQEAPDAVIIWCMTTPVRLQQNLEYLDKLNQQVIIRNQIALDVMGQNDILINNLYAEMAGHPEYYQEDGMHFNNDGRVVQADIISSFIQESR